MEQDVGARKIVKLGKYFDDSENFFLHSHTMLASILAAKNDWEILLASADSMKAARAKPIALLWTLYYACECDINAQKRAALIHRM